MAGRCRRQGRRLFVPLAIGLIVGLVWLFYPRPTDRELIVGMLWRGEHGLETKDVKEIMSCVAPDYGDSQNTTRTELLRMALQWRRVRERGEVTIESYDLDISPPAAEGTFEVVFVLIGQDGRRTALPMTLTMQFEQCWQRWRKVWLVKSVEGYALDSMMESVGG